MRWNSPATSSMPHAKSTAAGTDRKLIQRKPFIQSPPEWTEKYSVIAAIPQQRMRPALRASPSAVSG